MTGGKLSGEAFHRWYSAAFRQEVPSLRFIQRRFRRSWAHAEESFYVPEIGRLLAVLCASSMRVFVEESFRLSPQNLLADYRKRQTTPGTYYLDRAVFIQRRGEFELQQISAARTLWKGIEARGASWRPISALGLNGYAVDLVLSPADVETLCLSCESRELVFPPLPPQSQPRAAKAVPTLTQAAPSLN